MTEGVALGGHTQEILSRMAATIEFARVGDLGIDDAIGEFEPLLARMKLLAINAAGIDQLVTMARARTDTQVRLPGPSTCCHVRHSAGVSREELAQAIGVSAMTVRAWELGKAQPLPANASRWLEALGALVDARVGRLTGEELHR